VIFLHLPQGPEEEETPWRYLVQTLNVDYIRPEYSESILSTTPVSWSAVRPDGYGSEC
jgi:hypothetical protein